MRVLRPLPVALETEVRDTRRRSVYGTMGSRSVLSTNLCTSDFFK